MSAPDSPSAAPAVRPRTVRGTRTVQTMLSTSYFGVAGQRPDHLARRDVHGPETDRQQAEPGQYGDEQNDEQDGTQSSARGHRPGSTATILRLGMP